MEIRRIPKIIIDKEGLVRLVFSHYHVRLRDGQVIEVKKEAFLPPKASNEVSVLRLAYTTLDFCRQRGQEMQHEGKTLAGLAQVQAEKVRINADTEVKASPLDAPNQPLPESQEVFTNDPGTPMHADMVYDFVPAEAEPFPQEFKIIAKRIAEQSHFIK